jgi:hypothetical protein
MRGVRQTCNELKEVSLGEERAAMREVDGVLMMIVEEDLHMRRAIALILVVAMAWGCVATQRRPPATAVGGLRTIVVVPVEAPPLLLHPKTDADRAAIAAAGLASPGPGTGIDPGYLVLLPLFGVAGTALIYGASSSTPRAGEVITIVSESPPWMPTTGLARIAASALQKEGARKAFVVDGYAQLPVADRSVNVFLENWMAAERRWYNADVSMLDYTQLGVSRPDAIVEVGVVNYEYYADRLVLSVNVKLIDPTTKQVWGRARNFDWPKGEPLPAMLQDHGQPLRRLIETTGEVLLIKCLKDLGLIPS